MSTVLHPPKVREAKPAPPPAPSAPAAEVAPETAYRPDCWGFRFWLGCAAVLVLLHVIEWIGALLGR